MMDSSVLETLEYWIVQREVAALCHSAAATEAALVAMPADNATEAGLRLIETREAYLIRYELVTHPYFGFDEVAAILEQLRAGSTLDIPSLQKIGRLLQTAEKLQSTLLAFDDERIEVLPRLAAMIMSAVDLQEALTRCIQDEETLSDDASPRLAGARREIVNCQNRIKEKLNGYLRADRYNGVLQEKLVTIRDNRYVLPVKAEYRSAIPGLVHDVSDSGATIFVEPMPVVELNNKLREAQGLELEEIARILSELSRLAALHLDAIDNNRRYCIEFDLIFARAEFAERNRCIEPALNQKSGLLIERGRHPLLDRAKAVPNTVKIEGGKTIMIVSGPNTGGKTVVLKTVGLFCLMAYSGLFLPANSAQIPFFDRIFCDIGDRQSIQEGYSTFSSRMKNIVDITDHATAHSLVLLDELGSGTDPTEGAAIARSVLEYLAQKRIFGIVTTHFSDLKEFGLLSEATENASMEFDSATLKPTYRLRIGLPGGSNALQIAGNLGLRQEILTAAEHYLGRGKRTFEEALKIADDARVAADLERDTLTAERKKLESDIALLAAERDAVKSQYEKLERQAKTEVDRIVAHSVEDAENIIDEMKELLKEVTETNLLRAKQLRTKLEKMDSGLEEREQTFDPIKADSIKIGDTVVLKSIGSIARVKSLPDKQGRVEVTVGNMAMRLKLDDLGKERFAVPKNQKPKKKPTVNTATHSASVGNSPLMTEINLLGQTVDEAVINVDAFLDQAIQRGLEAVKIIHGVGTGALKKGIREYLKTLRYVKEFRDGLYGEGGYGVTVVTIWS